MVTAQNMAHPSSRTAFFERVKQQLDSRELYDEFLKLTFLFSKDIINVVTLVERSKPFLRDPELLADFKELVLYDRTLDDVELGPPGSIRTGPPEALSAQPVDDGEGPSYRRLPASVSFCRCFRWLTSG